MIQAMQLQVARHLFMAAALLYSFQAAEAAPPEPAPVLELAGGSLSNDGHVKIVWEVSRAEAEVEVQQAKNQNFQGARTVYRGHDRATFISGLEDGTYYYRIRYVGNPWSEPVLLTVRHHSLRLASILFSLGAIVFAFTVFIVVKGARQASAD